MIGIIGDLHLKDNLGYSDYIENGRDLEVEEILNFIVKSFKDCDKIFFLGDQLNGRSNSPHVIKRFVNFIERFSGKKIYITSGNHERFGDGRTSIDFLKEIKNDNWTICTNKALQSEGCVLLPYFTKSELGAENNEIAKEMLHEMLDTAGDNTILFTHHAISDTRVTSGILVDTFPEPILDKERLLKKFRFVVGGHIHAPCLEKKVLIAGSIFNNEVGETKKYVWKLDEKTLKVEQIELPGRGIYKIENPTKEMLNIPKNSIIKAIITKKHTIEEMEQIKKILSVFDAYIILEQINKKREKMHYGNGESILEFGIESLLEVYSKEKKINYEKLLKGYELIKQ